jgi:hypothetical protein
MEKIAVAVVAILIAAGIGWYLLKPKAEAPAPPPPPPVVQATPKAADVPVPPAADSDAQLRKAFAGASARPEWAKWLAEGDLLERFVVVADNLAEDVSPRKQLAFLAPAKPFKAVEAKALPTIDPKSYARYDGFADVIGSIDAGAAAGAVRLLHPLLESAYHKLGYPDRKLDDVLQKALQRLIDAPVVEAPIQLEAKGGIYKFAYEQLESQGAVEKHLLRMGPRNTKLIQSKARELSAALKPG